MLQLGNGYCFSVPKVAAQGRDAFSFSEFWSFGADDRCAAVASAILRDLEMLKGICDSDDCSIFISSGGGLGRLIYRMFSNIGLCGAGNFARRDWVE